MTASDSSTPNYNHERISTIYPLIDTHTHFDAPVFDHDRTALAQQAYERGVRHLVLVGYLARHFERMYETRHALTATDAIQDKDGDNRDRPPMPVTHIALGLHPFYIEQHTDQHLADMAQMLGQKRPIAIGEIGLDTFTDAMKVPAVFAKQQQFFAHS